MACIFRHMDISGMYSIKTQDSHFGFPRTQQSSDWIQRQIETLLYLKMHARQLTRYLNIFRLFRRFRKKPRPQQLTPESDFNNQTQQDLDNAQDEITELKKRLAEYDAILHLSNSLGPSASPPSPLQCPRPTIPPPPQTQTWLEDLWLCTDNTSRSLQKAERHWHLGYPLLALESITKAISSDPFLSYQETITCSLFAAAVQHSLARYAASSKQIAAAFSMLAREDLFDDNEPRTKELTGIAYFLQGRNLDVAGDLEAAYLSFSRAQGMPEYFHKAREFQQNVVVEFTKMVADSDAVSISSSLFPCLSPRLNASSASLGSLDSRRSG